MAQKKKKKKPVNHVNEQTSTKVEAPAYQEKAEPQFRWFIGLSVLIAVVSMGVMLYSGGLAYGSPLYRHLQIAAYVGMALVGSTILYGIKYNHTKNRVNLQAAGMVFVMLGLGNALWLLVSGSK